MNFLERENAAFFHTYKRLPIEIERGEGMYLFDTQGNRYLDMFSGLAVNALGYAHPRVTEAIAAQAARYTHLSNYYLQEPQIRLAEALLAATGFARVFFSNSGTEAVEGAIKIARKWGAPRGKNKIVSLSNAFHGRTLGALSLMDRENYRAGFAPFLPNHAIARFNDPASLEGAVDGSTAAVILEPIQGEGGIRPVTQGFARKLSALQQAHGFLLIADEIQSGVGRTGKFFAFQHLELHPDIAVIAKPIGGGLPLGAILGNGAMAEVLAPGQHGTTFGGNPVACAAGLATLEEILEKNLISNAAKMGDRLLQGFCMLQQKFPSLVAEVRGRGLMAGMELTREAEPVVSAMRDRRILINGTDKTVLRLLPPLIVNAEQVDETVEALGEVLGG